eukprot:TRINITY_DN2628_c0_g1_i1.p1 TRINITY_DN2628_c0_g1~~TRINITY_DN2628_c0_g1_i1.p1  ORF type:complete len:105 (-),score=5.79 TRINITY_DN2628_c0_g1_i1:22-336(-)
MKNNCVAYFSSHKCKCQPPWSPSPNIVGSLLDDSSKNDFPANKQPLPRSQRSIVSVQSTKSTIQRLHLAPTPQNRINSSFASLSKGWFIRLKSTGSRKTTTSTF